MSKIELDELLDRAAGQVRAAQPDPAVVEAAAGRVWERLSGAGAAAASTAAEVTEIHSCDDYQALIPAYVAGSLTEAEMLQITDELSMEAGFVLPPETSQADIRLRFFTKRREAILSGHGRLNNGRCGWQSGIARASAFGQADRDLAQACF